MTRSLAVDPGVLESVAGSLGRGWRGAQPGLALLADLGRDALGGLRTGSALTEFCRAWGPVQLALVARGEVLIVALERAGGDYARLDRGLLASAGPAFRR